MQKRFWPLAALSLLVAAPAMGQNLMDLGKGALQQELGKALPQAGSQAGQSGQTSSASGGTLGSSLSSGEIGAGLKDALKVASERVTSRLGATDGFNADPRVHIPLPGKLQLVQQGLKAAGQGQMLDDLELKLNRAAEEATPKAKQIFFDAVSRMTLDDAKGILNGPQDAATQYFKRTMTPDLKTAMRPVVDKTVSQSGAVQAYQGVAQAASSLPMVGQLAGDGPSMLTDHVLDAALSGIFTYLGDEEAAIRQNPAKRSTELLKKLFQ